MIRYLPRAVPAIEPRTSNAGVDHPMRAVTREIALEPDGWTPERAAAVTQLFDTLAPEWHLRGSEKRMEVVADAFERGGRIPDGTWVELGSGTGLVSPWLARRCRRLVAIDLSYAMLALAPPEAGLRVRADGALLPLPDTSTDALILVNAFLFPGEVRRIVSAEGVVVWVNTSGDDTPIYLPAEDVLRVLGPGWDAVASEAAQGTWAVARRS
ncbi:MAG: methyltransferase domain-containing protein [Acidimicrobiales bacterium]